MTISRREALQSLAGTLGVALAVPSAAGAEQHPVVAHIAQRPADTADASRAGAPAFLDPHQLATLALIADLIVPGAVASGSPQYIDDVLNVERPEVQRRFIGALAAVDAATRDQHATSFRELPPDRRTALLESAFGGPTESGTLREHVDHLKTWIAGAHFSSEAGMKELGWTGTLVFSSFPACSHPTGHE